MNEIKQTVVVMVLALSLASIGHAYITLNPVADTSFEWGINDNNYGTTDGLHLRQYTSNNRDYFAYIRFDLSSITNPITDATFRVQQQSGATINSGRIRVLGLDNLAGNTAQNWGETAIKPSTLGGEFTFPASALTNGVSPFYTNRVTSFDGDVAGITEEITSDAATLEIVKVSGQPLVRWLENRRTNGGLATLIVDIPAGQGVEYYLHSRETATNGAAPELQIFTNATVKVWPLGDSITYGANVAGGYRETLYSNLTARGYSIKLIGTSTGNASTLLSNADQAHHDGHSGYSITNAVNIDDGAFRAGIYEGVESWHSSIDVPDVILLMIGINDLNTGYQVDTAADRLDLLVNRLFGYFPNTRILVASLSDAQQVNSYRHGATNDIAAAVSNYNAGMLSVVAAHRAMGQKIERVDMHSKLTLADLADGLHPNAGGYVKMGNVWADAIGEAPAVNATRIRVFLQGGQSNADGRAGATEQPSYPDIDFYYNVNHIHDVGVVERLTTLFPRASRDRNLGPEITFGRRLADILGCDTNNTRLAIIKHAEGATSLYSNWKAGGNVTTTGDGAEYVTFQQTVANGMAALSNKYPNAAIAIEGMIWMQGETDAQAGHGAEYFGNLTNFIADVRATIKPNLPFVIGRLSNNQSNYLDRTTGATGVLGLGLVQNAQTVVDAADHRVGIVNTDDLGVNDPNDDIHFNTTSQLELGRRFAYETAYLVSVTSQLSLAQINAGLGEPNQDPDGDGIINSKEFIIGSDVSVSNPMFMLGLETGDTNSFSLSHPLYSNRLYQVEARTNLTDGIWSIVTTTASGSNGIMNLPVRISTDAAFYRVRAILR
ncbi:MAG: GDSL-type esterase/lipase family protein [Verrucomicrobia bacterium]|nr:GDSL-type esterase/lipase family protein [Verrucomicrobiota bacterium]